MASHRLSAEKVVGTLFEDELSLDESDSEDGEDVYGYLGEPIAKSKLNHDYCCMRTWVAKIETKIQLSMGMKTTCAAMRKV